MERLQVERLNVGSLRSAQLLFKAHAGSIDHGDVGLENSDGEVVRDSARVVAMIMSAGDFACEVALEGVAAVEELAHVLADAVTEDEATSWVRVNVVG